MAAPDLVDTGEEKKKKNSSKRISGTQQHSETRKKDLKEVWQHLKDLRFIQSENQPAHFEHQVHS